MRGHRVVRPEVHAGEVDAHHLAGLHVHHGGAGVPAERRAVVGHGRHGVAEAVDALHVPELPRLEALHVEDAGEDRVLHIDRVARVERGIAHHHDVASVEVAGRRRGEAQGSHGLQALDLQQCHVPVRMHHHHLADTEQERVRAIALAEEVDRGALALDERQGLAPEPLREQLGHMPVRHQQAVTHHEAGAAVGEGGMVGQLDAADRRQRRLDPGARGLLPEVLERCRGRGVGPIHHVHHRPLVREDDRLRDERVLGGEALAALETGDGFLRALDVLVGGPMGVRDALEQLRLRASRQRLDSLGRSNPLEEALRL